MICITDAAADLILSDAERRHPVEEILMLVCEIRDQTPNPRLRRKARRLLGELPPMRVVQ